MVMPRPGKVGASPCRVDPVPILGMPVDAARGVGHARGVTRQRDPDEIVIEFIPQALARPAVEVLHAMISAVWEQQWAENDLRIVGVIAAGQWLGQISDVGPVSGAPVKAIPAQVGPELSFARAVLLGFPNAPRVNRDFAQGVADMLAYATDATITTEPVPMVHMEAPERKAS